MNLNEIVRARPDVRVDAVVLVFFLSRWQRDVHDRLISPNDPVTGDYFDYYTDDDVSLAGMTPHNQPLTGKWNVRNVTDAELNHTFNQAISQMIRASIVKSRDPQAIKQMKITHTPAASSYDPDTHKLMRVFAELQARRDDLLRIFVYSGTQTYNPYMVVVMRMETTK